MTGLAAQKRTGSLFVEVFHAAEPVSGASIVVNGEAYETDANGQVTFAAAPGELSIQIIKEGFLPGPSGFRSDRGRGVAADQEDVR